MALVGIGGTDDGCTMVRSGCLSLAEIARLRAQGAVGDVLGNYVDIDGDVDRRARTATGWSPCRSTTCAGWRPSSPSPAKPRSRRRSSASFAPASSTSSSSTRATRAAVLAPRAEQSRGPAGRPAGTSLVEP